MTYKEKLYASYISTHVSPRKGNVTAQVLESRSKQWDRTLRQFLPEDTSANIVDLGCGYGSVVWWMQRAGFRNASGIDISAEQVETANSLGVSNVFEADIMAFLENRKCEFDLILARDVIEHFDKSDVVDLLTRCHAALRENGVIVIQTVNAESPFSGRIIYGDFTHETAFTVRSMSQILNMTGFQKVQFQPTKPLIYSWKSFLKYVLWRIVEKAYKLCLFAEVGRTDGIVTQCFITVASK